MNNAKSYAVTYLGIGLGLIVFSLLPQVWNSPSLIALGVASLSVALMFLLSLKFRWRWLIKAAERVGRIPVTHIALFLMLISFALALMQVKYILPGILVILVSYMMLSWVIGRQLGRDVLRPLFDKWNIFMPSMKLPKDI